MVNITRSLCKKYIVHNFHMKAISVNRMSSTRIYAKHLQPKHKPSRWLGLDTDISDDQQDIMRGKGKVDKLFQGNTKGTHNVTMISSEYTKANNQANNKDNTDYYISQEFYETVLLHIMKNFYTLPSPTPLILGIWGAKGQGKTFQTQHVLSKLEINPVIISAGELESPNAGDPANLLRTRYHEAAEIIEKGQLCALLINDLDAGLGRMGNSQYTVNNQTANATLMNIADNPTNVQLPGIYNQKANKRVPIIITANDLNTLYAPLTRDGRMSKYEWNPSFDDKFEICKILFNSIDEYQLRMFVEKYDLEPIDFFGKVRSDLYNSELISYANTKNYSEIKQEMVQNCEYEFNNVSMELLYSIAENIAEENDKIKNSNLSEDYL